MALSASVLSGLIRTALAPTADGTGNASHAVDNPQLTALCDAIAGAVVAHITSAGVVLPGTLVAPPGTAGGPILGAGEIT
jgi:hypothetical protein